MLQYPPPQKNKKKNKTPPKKNPKKLYYTCTSIPKTNNNLRQGNLFAASVTKLYHHPPTLTIQTSYAIPVPRPPPALSQWLLRQIGLNDTQILVLAHFGPSQVLVLGPRGPVHKMILPSY